MALEKVVAERAERRMLSGVKIDPVDDLSTGAEKGKTRDDVAKKYEYFLMIIYLVVKNKG